MKALIINEINKRKRETHIEISLGTLHRITLLNSDAIKLQLTDMITTPGTNVCLNVKGLRFIDSTGFDCLNQLSWMARKHNSSFSLRNVEPELKELIDLVKRYNVFDVEVIEQTVTKKVA